MKLWHAFSAMFLGLCATLAAWALLADEPQVLAAAAIGWVILTMISKHILSPIEAAGNRLEALAGGDVVHTPLPLTSTFAETARILQNTNRLSEELADVVERADELSRGHVGVVQVEGAVLRSGRLDQADMKIRKNAGQLETAFTNLTNQLRHLAIQARIIARDDLQNKILDQDVPGEVGEAFSQMVGNLRSLNSRADLIASGDLTTQGGTIGDGDLNASFNIMTDRLIALVSEITNTALHISASTEQMSAVLREQEFAASHQASSVEETQRTMETLLSSAKKIAESAQTVFKSAERTQANNRTVAERIGELKSHTERIGEILDVIKSIADRSDLLALNASLEGMRAGEAGKGFTLVAAEMRRLAENIKDSVGDINELLVDIRESSLSSVMATEEGTNLSERTTESALKITLITQQQQSGTEQVTQSMEELSLLINHGVSGTQQLGSASSELVDLAEGLRRLVERFRTGSAVDISSESLPVKTSSYALSKPTAKRKQVRDVHETPLGLAEQSSAKKKKTTTAKDDDQPTLELSMLSEDDEADISADLADAAARITGAAIDSSQKSSVVDQLDAIDAALSQDSDASDES